MDRCTAPAVELPFWGRLRPEVCALRGNATGTAQFYLWDRAGGGIRQLTDAPHGVELGLLDPAGRWLWWYHDEDGTEHGTWMRAPLRGGPAVPALPGVPPGTPEGLAVGASGLAVAGVTAADGRTDIHLLRAGADRAEVLYGADTPLYLGGLSDDEAYVLVLHAEYGDPQRPSLRVLDQGGALVGELRDWPHSGLHVVPYGSPFLPGGRLVLATHTRGGRPAPCCGTRSPVRCGRSPPACPVTYAPGSCPTAPRCCSTTARTGAASSTATGSPTGTWSNCPWRPAPCTPPWPGPTATAGTPSPRPPPRPSCATSPARSCCPFPARSSRLPRSPKSPCRTGS